MESTAGIRARVRIEIIGEIKRVARGQVAEGGPAAVSLRAVARQLGMVSSGIYRYYSSRDELLTDLIIDAYDALGAEAEEADGRCGRPEVAARWHAICGAVRSWALANPHEYALIHGSPVPGYRAPEDTIGPASRVTLALAAVVRDAAASGALQNPFGPERSPVLSKPSRVEALRVGSLALPGVPADAVVRALTAWTQLFGYVSFEVFGRLVGVVDDPDAIFVQAVADMAAFVGIPPLSARRRMGSVTKP